MTHTVPAAGAAGIYATWRDIVAPYEKPHTGKSLWQVANTLVPYFALWYLMYLSLGVSYWLTLALSVPAAGLLTRIFVLQHDCGHGAFFASKRMNAIFGSIMSTLCSSPYRYWQHEHALHHAGAGNLDRRGHGDIWTMTVREYRAASPRTRLAYRIYRNPFVLFGVGVLYMFMIDYRIPRASAHPLDRRSVWRTNAAIAAVLAVVYFTIGLKAFLLVQLPIFAISAGAGAWLFYVQHQYEDAYWQHKKDWNYVDGALKGSSYYRLPRVLQWLTGNIGFHHIHHLSARIPNYNLERCHNENPIFQNVHVLTLRSSLECLRFRLWDEDAQRMIGYAALRAQPA